jgi:sulfite exporter TauE/SafE
MFNIGRVISYGVFGAVLGLLGGALRLSQNFTSLLVVAVSVVMAILALQMLGVRAFDHFRFALPKSVTRKIADGKSGPPTGGKAGPFIAGFLTFFLPCGFTLIAQGAAVLSGGALRGGLIMAAFALGTFIPLMIIGLSSTKLLSNEKWSQGFLKVAGLLVLFFVAYNLNVQFNIVRYFAANNNQVNNQVVQPVSTVSTTTVVATPATSGDVQVIKIIYTSQNDIQPATFTVKVGQKVRMEVDVRDNGSGCMSTIMVPGLYNQAQYLQKGQILVMEFTPDKAGDYQITCAMGVPRGLIKVIN